MKELILIPKMKYDKLVKHETNVDSSKDEIIDKKLPQSTIPDKEHFNAGDNQKECTDNLVSLPTTTIQQGRGHFIINSREEKPPGTRQKKNTKRTKQNADDKLQAVKKIRRWMIY